MILLPIIYFLIVAIHAGIDWYLIKIKKKTINHKFESVIYILICIILGAVALITGFGWGLLPLILFPLLTRAAFFDALLNRLTGHHWLYEGIPKLKNKESIWDRIERLGGLPTALYRIFYLIAYFGYLIIYLWQNKILFQ